MGRLRGLARAGLERSGMGRAVEGFDLPDAVCLTYDDGPDPRGTRTVLGQLAERGATATFFVMANRVRRHPEVLQEVLRAGHEVALHGPDHRDLSADGPVRVRRLVLDARAEVEDVAGRGVTWFRPPYVALRLDGWVALRGTGLRFAASGAAIRDWQTELDDARRVALLRADLSPGDVVLAHDSWAGEDDHTRRGREPVLDRGWLCARALDIFAERGLRTLTLSGAAAEGAARTATRAALRRGASSW
ncbi:MAG TPA: polysaccharide deacetylase family protein [Ornithinimicrobium sp.]|nr:polysaccharide deacetylase family protein [Ornithinimicrobium sp.]